AEGMKTSFALRTLLGDLSGRSNVPALASSLQVLSPFAIEGEARGNFLVIEDPGLLAQTGERAGRISPALWKSGPHTAGPRTGMDVYLGAAPLVVFMGDIGPESKRVLPQACILDSQELTDRPPFIWWNSLKDLPPSKLMHVSFQPFYLRRYARRVASL